MINNYTDYRNLTLGPIRLLLDLPFRDGYKEWQIFIRSQDSSVGSSSPSIMGRIKNIILGTLLYIPLVNIIVDVALRVFASLCSYRTQAGSRPSGEKPKEPPPATIEPPAIASELMLPLKSISDASPTPPIDPVNERVNAYTKFADSWALLDSMRIYFQKVIDLPEWNSTKARAFIRSELQALRGALEELEAEAPKLMEVLAKKTSLEEALKFDDMKIALTESRKDLQNLLKSKFPELVETPVIGLKNARNTCYINSALQPLLALGNFPDLLPETIEQMPDESDEIYLKRSMIMGSLREFIEAWQRKSSPYVLGQKIGALRADIFQAGLMEGGFVVPEEEEEFQDAGSFFELVLYVIGHRFLRREIKIPYDQNGVPIPCKNPVVEIQPSAIYLTKVHTKKEEYDGKKRVSVKERVEACGNPEKQDGAHWIVTKPNDEKVEAAEFIEKRQILGEPPEFLILGVHHNVGVGSKTEDVGHVVSPEDFVVDFSPLFETPIPPAQAQYDLVGFSQNHHQTHWTSVVRSGQGWKYCDDETLSLVDDNSPKFAWPANYMVYKKKR